MFLVILWWFYDLLAYPQSLWALIFRHLRCDLPDFFLIWNQSFGDPRQTFRSPVPRSTCQHLVSLYNLSNSMDPPHDSIAWTPLQTSENSLEISLQLHMFTNPFISTTLYYASAAINAILIPGHIVFLALKKSTLHWLWFHPMPHALGEEIRNQGEESALENLMHLKIGISGI